LIGNVVEGEILNVAKFRTGSIETYECIADNGIGDALRKKVTINFSGETSYFSSIRVNRRINVKSNLLQNVAPLQSLLIYILL